MAEEKISHKFRSNKIDGTRNYFIEEMKQNDLMSKKYKKVCTASKYVKQSLVLNFAVTLFVSIFTFFLLGGIPIRIVSSAVVEMFVQWQQELKSMSQ